MRNIYKIIKTFINVNYPINNFVISVINLKETIPFFTVFDTSKTTKKSNS